MIEEMKHAFVICRQQDRQNTVDRLGRLGIVHVVDVNQPQSGELERLQSEYAKVEDALNSLREFEKENGRPGNSSENIETEVGKNPPPDQLAEAILQLLDQLETAREKEAHWLGIEEKMIPWGGFSKDLYKRLTAAGLTVRLFSFPLNSLLPDLPEQVMLHEISRDKHHRFLLLICPPGIELPDQPEPIVIPEETELTRISEHIDNARGEQRKLIEEIRTYLDVRPQLSDYLLKLRKDLEFAQARAGMGEAEAVCYLQGYIPAANSDDLEKAAKENGWGLLLQEPDKEDPHVPTKIRLARWAEPIRLVFQAMGIMPGYWEIDISAWFMLFLSIFFALLFGDAGYGALFLLLTLILRKILPQAPARPFWLFGIFSFTTLVWGVISGTYFGIQENLWWPLERLQVEPMAEDANIQKLCFLLGAIHLTIAHAWNGIIYGRSLKTLAEIAWIAILWGNFHLAQVLVLGAEPPDFMLPLYGAGLVGIIMFSRPDRNPLKMIAGGIGSLLLGLVNSFVDVVSYIRLYAVGAATVAVADSFNQMALEFLPGWSTFLIGVVILLLGHSLNIVLGLMSVLVHGVRLNVLEFSQHIGLQWSGISYSPLQYDSVSGGKSAAEATSNENSEITDQKNY